MEATASSGLALAGSASKSIPTPKMGSRPVALTGDAAADPVAASGPVAAAAAGVVSSPRARAGSNGAAASNVSASAASAREVVPAFMIGFLQMCGVFRSRALVRLGAVDAKRDRDVGQVSELRLVGRVDDGGRPDLVLVAVPVKVHPGLRKLVLEDRGVVRLAARLIAREVVGVSKGNQIRLGSRLVHVLHGRERPPVETHGAEGLVELGNRTGRCAEERHVVRLECPNEFAQPEMPGVFREGERDDVFVVHDESGRDRANLVLGIARDGRRAGYFPRSGGPELVIEPDVLRWELENTSARMVVQIDAAWCERLLDDDNVV